MKKRFVLGCLIAFTAVIGVLCLPYHPLYQEWVCRDASLDKLESLRTQLPDNPSLFYYLGRRLSEAQRSEEAILLLQKAIALDPDSARLYDTLAAAQMARGQTREAYSGLRQFYETHPNNADAPLMMARFYLTTQTFAPAVELLKDATRTFPENPEYWALLAIAQRRINDTKGAENAAATATWLRPQESKYWFLQAQLLKQARKSSARASYERALQLSPTDLAIQADFADYLVRNGDDSTAEKYARAVLEQLPKDLRASGAFGLVLAHRGDFAAFPHLRNGLQNDSRDILILRTLHRLAVKQGSTVEAKKWLRELLRVQALLQEESNLAVKLNRDPGNVVALRQMAALMGRNGDYFRCMQYHARAMGQVADAPGPLLAAAKDLKLGGFLQQAQQLAKQSRENSTTPGERDAATDFLRQSGAE